MFMFCGFLDTIGQEITKGDILKTVQHIQQLSREQKQQLLKAQADFEAQGVELSKQTELANKWHAEAHDNARQRDSILILFGVIAACYFGTFFAGPILREFPTPWNLVGVSLAYIVTGFAAYGIGRILVANIARFIP